jgi:hypothetical protein
MADGYMSAVEFAHAARDYLNAERLSQYRYAKAWQRVNSSPRLRRHAAILLGDGYASDEDHLRWVIRGKVSEIVAWAEQIRRDSVDG